MGPEAQNAPVAEQWYGGVLFLTAESERMIILKQAQYPVGTIWTNQTINGIWYFEGWARLATATPPAVYDLPLAAGWSAISAKYYRTQDGMITVNVLGLTNGSSAAGYSNWGILPEGFRPFTIILAPAINTSGWTITSAGQPTGTISETIFWSDGSLCIHRTDATTSQCSFNATFRAA